METLAGSFITSYILMPLLAFIMGIVAFFLAKKNKILRNRKLIVYVLVVSLLLCLPGFLGFIDYWFMPYTYAGLMLLYLLLGWYNMRLLRRIYLKPKKGAEETPYYIEICILFVMMFIGAAFFSMIFNFFNELKYGIWASTCLLTFLLPSLYSRTYASYMNIPLEIYKIWRYGDQGDLSSFDYMDYNKLHVMELEVFKDVADKTPSKIKAKAPDNMPFGIWFQKFLTDYNTKFYSTPIMLKDKFTQEEYCWIFYIKPSFFLPRKYIDFEISISENNIKEKHTIIAKRVSEQTNEEISGTYQDNEMTEKKEYN